MIFPSSKLFPRFLLQNDRLSHQPRFGFVPTRLLATKDHRRPEVHQRPIDGMIQRSHEVSASASDSVDDDPQGTPELEVVKERREKLHLEDLASAAVEADEVSKIIAIRSHYGRRRILQRSHEKGRAGPGVTEDLRGKGGQDIEEILEERKLSRAVINISKYAVIDISYYERFYIS